MDASVRVGRQLRLSTGRLLGLAVAAASLLPGVARAQNRAPYQTLKALESRLSRTADQASEGEVEGIVSEATQAITQLAGTSGESGGMPNPVAAYFHGMRVAGLLYHGHGWGTFARTVVGTVQSAVVPQLPEVGAQLTRTMSELAGVRDGIRLDRQAPDGSEDRALSDVSTSHCSQGGQESLVRNVATSYLSQSATGGGAEIQGIYCDFGDPENVWRAIAESTQTYQQQDGTTYTSSSLVAVLVDTANSHVVTVITLDDGSSDASTPCDPSGTGNPC